MTNMKLNIKLSKTSYYVFIRENVLEAQCCSKTIT